MIGLLGKIDSAVLAILGGLGWVLQTNDHDGAVAVGLAAATSGAVGLLVAVVVWFAGGHQVPALTSTVGHVAPWFGRAAILIGLAWVGAWVAAAAGVKPEGAAVAASVVIFTGLGEVLKPLREATDSLRPAVFGRASIGHVYGDRFDVQPGAVNFGQVTARAAVHDDLAQIHDQTGSHVETIQGWKRRGRQRRLELIADGL